MPGLLCCSCRAPAGCPTFSPARPSIRELSPLDAWFPFPHCWSPPYPPPDPCPCTIKSHTTPERPSPCQLPPKWLRRSPHSSATRQTFGNLRRKAVGFIGRIAREGGGRWREKRGAYLAAAAGALAAAATSRAAVQPPSSSSRLARARGSGHARRHQHRLHVQPPHARTRVELRRRRLPLVSGQPIAASAREVARGARPHQPVSIKTHLVSQYRRPWQLCNKPQDGVETQQCLWEALSLSLHEEVIREEVDHKLTGWCEGP